jgi:hypothetical protein
LVLRATCYDLWLLISLQYLWNLVIITECLFFSGNLDVLYNYVVILWSVNKKEAAITWCQGRNIETASDSFHLTSLLKQKQNRLRWVKYFLFPYKQKTNISTSYLLFMCSYLLFICSYLIYLCLPFLTNFMFACIYVIVSFKSFM